MPRSPLSGIVQLAEHEPLTLVIGVRSLIPEQHDEAQAGCPMRGIPAWVVVLQLGLRSLGCGMDHFLVLVVA